MTYVTTDRRRIAQLPVRDAIAAEALATIPLAQVDPEIEPYVPAPVEEKKYDLTPLQLHFGEFLRYHTRAKEANSWLKEFKKVLPGVVGDASLMVMGNLPVATFRHDAKLSMKRLQAEQPHIVEKYTRMVTKEEFDQDAFRRDDEAMYRAYCGRSFRLVTSGPGAGLVLPS